MGTSRLLIRIRRVGVSAFDGISLSSAPSPPEVLECRRHARRPSREQFRNETTSRGSPCPVNAPMRNEIANERAPGPVSVGSQANARTASEEIARQGRLRNDEANRARVRRAPCAAEPADRMAYPCAVNGSRSWPASRRPP